MVGTIEERKLSYLLYDGEKIERGSSIQSILDCCQLASVLRLECIYMLDIKINGHGRPTKCGTSEKYFTLGK